jgi:drug/metabolite transporter (DMT)-like permease
MKALVPYFTKHVLITLRSSEFLFISYILDFILVVVIAIGYILYDYKYVHKHTGITFNNCKKLTIYQMGSILGISLVGLLSTFAIFEMNNMKNPIIIFILTKVAPIVIIGGISVFILKESFTYKKIIGIVLAIISIYLIGKD